MKTFRFINFKVYKDSKDLYLKVLPITDKLKNYPLKDQTERAVLSIILNIAEGSAKKSDKEFARFLQISLGSVNELAACLDVMLESNLIIKSQYEKLVISCEDIARQLGGFSKKLRN